MGSNVRIERVLIVEDREDEAKQLSVAFRRLLGRTASGDDPAPWTSDLENALRLLTKESFSVVLLDLSFPHSQDEGMRVLRFLRAIDLLKINDPRPPVVILTARHIIPLCVRAMQAGAADYVLKGAAEGASLDEDTIDRAFKACKSAVAKATKVEEAATDQWLERNQIWLMTNYPNKYLAIFLPEQGVRESIPLAERSFIPFDSQQQAVSTILEHLEWLDHQIHFAFISGGAGDASRL